MAINSFNDYSTNPALNTDIAGTSIAVGCPPADVGVFMRTLLAQIAYGVTGTGGTIPATWHVGTLFASTITNSGASAGTAFTPTGAAVPAAGMYLPAANQLGFATNTLLRATIDASGNFLVGTTNTNPITNGVNGFVVQGNGVVNINATTAPLNVGVNAAGNPLVEWFAAGPTNVGSVSTAGAITSYNTTSDQRLKVKIGVIEYVDAAEVIDRLAALWFHWKDGDIEPQPGFFAQQVHRICPWAVTKGRGRVGSKNFRPWQMDASKLMPFVIAYIQGLGKRVAALEKARS